MYGTERWQVGTRGQALEHVKLQEYLGSFTSSKGKADKEIKRM
jgi:hypothetical protein